MSLDHFNNGALRAADGIAYGLSALTLTGVLSSVSAVLTIVLTALSILWFGIRIYDRWKYGPMKARSGD